MGMLHTECVGKLGLGGKATDERVGISIGDLKTDTKQHREYEEQGHLLLAEQSESLQSECLGKGTMLIALGNWTLWQRERIEEEHYANDGRGDKLPVVGLETHDIHKPHGEDESYRAEHSDWREILNGVHSCLSQSGISHRIGQCYCGHIESHRHGIEREDGGKIHPTLCRGAIPCRENHEHCCHEMAYTKHLLCRNPAVGCYTNDSRHKD